LNNFTILIKPASADCNLRCRYCFYLEKQKLYPSAKYHRMSDAILERLISGYLTTNQFNYSFIWQGGEPTLMGAGFFKRVTELQRKYARPGSRITNCLQTNATLINDDMAEHFARHHFLIGCSLDGSAEIHDRYRKYAGEKPSHKAVLKGIEILRRHGVEFNILTLVSKANVHHARNVYRYLVNNGFAFHQYIPCVEFDTDGTPLPYSITGPEWGKFLCEIFDNWFSKDADTVSVRNFDVILSKQLDNINSVCSLADNCCQYFVVEYNGDIYPCDFFVEKKLLIGNVADTTWKEALASKTYREFGGRKADLNQHCLACSFLNLCMGDCQKYRLENDSRYPGISYLCEGWLHFFEHTKYGFESLGEKIQANRLGAHFGHQRVSLPKKTTASGCNQPCPCGSEKKYKKCCGR